MISLLASLVLVAPVQEHGLASAVTLSGLCEQLVILGEDHTERCGPGLINTTYDNGRSSFAFTVEGVGLVTFSGPGVNQTREGDHVSQPLDRVMLLSQGAEPGVSEGAGTCEFGNPFAGVTTIVCTIQTQGGETSARFVSDGAAPVTQEF